MPSKAGLQQPTATDVDRGDQLNMLVVSAPDFFSLDSCAQNYKKGKEELKCTFTFNNPPKGTYKIILQADDGKSESVTRDYNIRVR